MSEPAPQKTTSNEPSFKLNYVTAILLLVILIPIAYTVVVNLESPPPPPVIVPVANTANQVVVTPANQLQDALKAVADKPGADTYVALGMIYYNMAQYEDGIKAWEKALTYNPKSEVAYNDIAAAYGAMHKWDDEIKACQKALAINPDFDLAKHNLAWAASQKK